MATFTPGKVYVRRELHKEHGGAWQNGIAPSADGPVIFLFTGESGERHGYRDGLQPDGTPMWLHHQKQAASKVLDAVPKVKASEEDEALFERALRAEMFRFQVNQIRLVGEGGVLRMTDVQRAEAVVRLAREAIDLKPGETLEALKDE